MKKIIAVLFLLLLPSSVFALEGVSAPIVRGDFVFGPVVGINVVKINLKSGDISNGLIPGLGYGFVWKKILGVDAFVNARVAGQETSTSIGFSVLVSFVKYLSTGVGVFFSDGREPQYEWLLGGSIPIDFNRKEKP